MRGSIPSAAGLVWRHQRLLWWIFVLNLALAWLSALVVRATIAPVLDTSFESAKLVTGFDVSTLVLLLEQPEVPTQVFAPSAMAASAFWLLVMLALDGGVVTTYLEDRRLSLAEFSSSCAMFFWRMVRLALFGLLPFAGLLAAQTAVSGYSGKLSRNALLPRLGFEVDLAATLLIVFAALLVRLWFDVAQARIVLGNERSTLRTLLRNFIPTLRSGLYWKYFGIALFAVACAALGLAIWINLPHQAFILSFVVLELVTIAQIAARLWMKAACARWAALQPEPVVVSTAALEPTPAVESSRS